ncbi:MULTISPECIES: BtpA/SgcQ family protein [unclassified Modestobacter]|uniref:BtpA/SgcQ family protein n=1 Tax=unclassified Modestobacter TaxID=2643866 RepID=UPI0022AA2B38|nr:MULTISPECIES: BtpA/SgcQ family protein [unclassified Modestobacter]MCZ2810969.1 BtpA/SgcQ family protein [Modestobacter sp. VKM Ac-2979]MCZ2823059.1 BtpA/SgcQ family protein [Modestobacter sp. VKM Ac-2981]MCZ2840482.1 BtpA/SgcQ family protein [Modestobacter sp. VKM Ac-2980]MCZ2849609.1 BtpA/SgcQ family protein [Modestobacter sp. VKM Ac-2978]MCZ2851305.1 BtpA/SgcQ family protein [Modestobacter sp. VKM Ac-2982]
MAAQLGVYPRKPSAMAELFGTEKTLVGAVHLPPLPGSPSYRGQSVAELCRFAVEETQAYVGNGFDTVIVENHWDLPFLKPGEHGYEVAATMGVITAAVVAELGTKVGVSVLSNAGQCSVAAAWAAGAGWIRVNQWANAYVANEGIIEGQAASTTRYRHAIGADPVKVFADVHVKHGAHAIVADRTLAEQTEDAEFFDADVLIATGSRTGHPTSVAEVVGIRDHTQLPVIIGSGIDPTNVGPLLAECDGAIVASAAKENSRWWGRVDPEKVRAVARAAGR